jgi:hypothetical protein
MFRRVGLLTLALHNNYGGILQALALHEVLRGLSLEVVLLERRAPPNRRERSNRRVAGFVPYWLLRALLPGDPARSSPFIRSLRRIRDSRRIVLNERLISRHIPLRSGPLTDSASFSAAVGALGLEAVIVGSDQVWRPDYLPSGSVRDFFLGSVASARRVSYAASFGFGDWRFPAYSQEVTECLRAFHAVSVREASGVDICRDVFHRDDAVHVLDPTMLVEPSFYGKLAAPARSASGKTLLEYGLDRAAGEPSVGNGISRALGEGHTVSTLGLDYDTGFVSVGDWLRAFMDADMVVTDSFHGVIFSILFRKPFVALANEKRGAERFISLLAQFNLSDRLVYSRSVDEMVAVARRPIDYAATAERLSVLRAHSMAFLTRALG